MNSIAGSITAPGHAFSASRRVSWTVWTCLAASLSIAIGLYWDISWHETIGRDTFWTPAHLLIHFGGILTAAVCAFTIFGATLQPNSTLRQVSVNVLGFRGPLGAFVAAWGGMAMVTSAPFDNWWHDAYGLDVKILSPPHIILAIGIGGIVWGGILLAISEMNRASAESRPALQRVVLVLAGMAVLQGMILRLENTNKIFLHSSNAYLSMGIGVLLIIESLARATGHRWARTIMTGAYSLFVLLMMWILPLFPASPKLGPVYHPIDHMVPLPFPLLLIVPAFVLDLAWPLMANWKRWQQSMVGGFAFMAILIAVQWPMATFLMSPAARNWFFAPANYPFFAPPSSAAVRYVFLNLERSPSEFWINIALAFVFSAFSMWVGTVFGEWLKKLKR